MSGCHIPNVNIYINQYLEWKALAFMFQGQEPDSALALCQWKLSEISLGILKSCEAKLMIALSTTKFPYKSLFNFYVHTVELFPSSLYMVTSLSFVTDGLRDF